MNPRPFVVALALLATFAAATCFAGVPCVQQQAVQVPVATLQTIAMQPQQTYVYVSASCVTTRAATVCPQVATVQVAPQAFVQPYEVVQKRPTIRQRIEAKREAVKNLPPRLEYRALPPQPVPFCPSGVCPQKAALIEPHSGVQDR